MEEKKKKGKVRTWLSNHEEIVWGVIGGMSFCAAIGMGYCLRKDSESGKEAVKLIWKDGADQATNRIFSIIPEKEKDVKDIMVEKGWYQYYPWEESLSSLFLLKGELAWKKRNIQEILLTLL